MVDPSARPQPMIEPSAAPPAAPSADSFREPDCERACDPAPGPSTDGAPGPTPSPLAVHPAEAGCAPCAPGLDLGLLSRIEDASLNASAPPQQRWLDGWLMRFSPGKARRARCVNAVAGGRLPWRQRLALAEAAYAEAGLPPLFRITPFSQPPGLDAWLQAEGWTAVDPVQVMVATSIAPAGTAIDQPAPEGLRWMQLAPGEMAEAVGTLRGSPPAQRAAQAQRLALAPVPYLALALVRAADGSVQACGQVAREGDLLGLFDVFTRPEARGRGLAGILCKRLLSIIANEGGKVAYLQVDIDNPPARQIYRRLGFVDAYRYHYRTREPGA
jgi:GNAT superfamily N-acetyltransferase